MYFKESFLHSGVHSYNVFIRLSHFFAVLNRSFECSNNAAIHGSILHEKGFIQPQDAQPARQPAQSARETQIASYIVVVVVVVE